MIARQPRRRDTLRWLAAAPALSGLPVHAAQVRFEPVADGIHAFIGETGARTLGNEGLNANFGAVVTGEGVLLIDSGATWDGARQIHEAIRRITPQPVRWVINTGGQDHRWLGNGYFRDQGAELIAHGAAESDMRQRGGDHLAALRTLLGPRAARTEAVLPTRWISGTATQLRLGRVDLVLRHAGGAHTPGDMMVWLPAQRVMFSGDVVYVDRLLGVLPVSRTRGWLDTFTALEGLQPDRIVPGHGQVCSLAKAQAQTRDYLTALRAHMKRAVDEGTDLSAAVKSFDSAPWAGLLNAAELMPGNASRVYLELERE